MRFLLDHDVPADLSYSLQEMGHESIRLSEVMSPTSSDNQVIAYAASHRLVLITCNRDDFLLLAESTDRAGLIICIRRKTRVAERTALVQLIDKAGERGIQGNINSA